MNGSSEFSPAIDKKTFSVARRGYSKKEVRAFLDDVEVAFADLERHARVASDRIGDLERQLESMKAAESKTMDNALYSVFDAKDRILDKAHRRAEKVEIKAQERAAELVQEAEKNLAASRAGRGPVGGETSTEIIADAHAEAARIREDAARFAATVSDGDVGTIAEELAKARADLIAERARADKAQETAHRKGQELNDLLRDASETEGVEDLSEARSHGATIVAQAQEEAESILERARDEAKTVRELARKEGDRATAVAAMRDLAYDTDPAAALQQQLETAADVESSLRGELAEAKSAVETLEQSLSDSSAGVERAKETGAERVEELESEVSAAAASLEVVQAELATAVETNAKVSELESALAETTTTSEHLRASLEESSAAVSSTEERNADLEERLAAALTEGESLEAVRAELVEALDSAGKLNAAEKEIAELTAALDDLRTEVTALDSRILDMRAAVADVQGERDAYEQANTALEAKVEQLQDRAHDLPPSADATVSEMSITSEIREDVPDSPVDAATAEVVATPFVRGRSRYERNSAKLPRIGDQGESVLESMRNLRASMIDK